jgi:hypothetical protein
MQRYSVIIGRAEPVDIVGLTLDVPAKIDSGAYRSSIHASDIKVKKTDGGEVLTCKLLGHPCAAVQRPFSTTDFDTVKVRSSNGHEETRYEVKLRIKLGNKNFNTSFSLADRSDNLFPILIGRKALKSRFLIDASKTNIQRQRLMKDYGITEARDEEDLED